jgi:hypothetical protein
VVASTVASFLTPSIRLESTWDAAPSSVWKKKESPLALRFTPAILANEHSHHRAAYSTARTVARRGRDLYGLLSLQVR